MNDLYLRSGARKVNFRKYIADLRASGGVQHFRFNTGLRYFKYSILVSGHKSRFHDVSKTRLDDLTVNGSGLGK